MVRDLVIEIKPAEPSIREMKFDFLGQPAFRAQAIAVSDDEQVIVTAALADVHERLEPYYSEIGRPSVDRRADPEGPPSQAH